MRITLPGITANIMRTRMGDATEKSLMLTISALTFMAGIMTVSSLISDSSKTEFPISSPGVGAASTADEDRLREKLKSRPASGIDWLRLAEVRFNRLGMDDLARSALQMSELTEPKEIDSIVGRISFFFSMWEALPPKKQAYALSELTASLPSMYPEHVQLIRVSLQNMPPASRQVIRKRLIVQGGEQPWMNALGF